MSPNWIVLFDIRDEPAWLGTWLLPISLVLFGVGLAIGWRAFRSRFTVFALTALLIVAVGGTLAIRQHEDERLAFASADYRVVEGVVSAYGLAPSGKSLRFAVGKANFEVSAGFVPLVRVGDYLRIGYIERDEILRIERRAVLGSQK
jgi:hypothetical protein